jgi:predicted O-methyltransferase YrrM
MSASEFLPSAIVAYLAKVNPPEHMVLARCREETAALANATMQISAEQGAFMAFLARLTGAKRAFEVGVFTGYSSLAVALAMRDMHGAEAHLLACDVSEEWTSKARSYWREAGVSDAIELVLAPGAQTMAARVAAGEGGSYDFGFVDADKTGYDSYYEHGLALLRPGGLMLFDNVLWSGRVAEPGYASPDSDAMKALALKAKGDARVHEVMAAIGDGLLMCIKR